MLRRDWFSICLIVTLGCTVLAALTAQPGGDYFFDSGSIDAIVRGDWSSFFAQQPLMGPVSLFVRAPFVALVFHSSLTTVYLIGVIPCYLALLVLARVLWAQMHDRTRAERIAVVVVAVASPVAVRAVHWGHPEDFLAAAFAVGAVLAAGRDRPVVSGVLLALGYASKQWAVVAAAPALATLPSRRGHFVVAAGIGGLALTLPMLLGDPDRFWLVTRAAGSPDPSAVLGQRTGAFPAGHVAPHSLWMPLGTRQEVQGRSYLFMNPELARLTHPLIVAIGLPLSWLAYRRSRGPLPMRSALLLLALVLALRCALDPNDLDYYHVPLMTALAAAAAFGSRRDVVVALGAAAGLSLAFAQPADNLSVLTNQALLMWAVYMATIGTLCWWLARELYFAPRRAGEVNRASRSPRSQAATSSA